VWALRSRTCTSLDPHLLSTGNATAHRLFHKLSTAVVRLGMADPRRNGDRNKAHRLRAKLDAGQAIGETDAKFLQNYDSRRSERPSPIAAPPVVLQEALESGADVGASEEGRTVKFELKENRKAIGTGDAAPYAAGLAAMSKSHGDSIAAMAATSRVNLEVLKEAVNTYKSIAEDLREGMRDLMQSELDTRAAYRLGYLKNVALEGQLRDAVKAKEQDEDPVNQMVLIAAAKLLGVDLPGIDAKVLEAATSAATKPSKR
jgi:hypothetical protein